MLVLRDPASTTSIPDREVRTLAAKRFAMLSEDEPFDPDVFGYFIVVEDGDNITALDEQLGFPILSNRFDGTCFGDSGFTPCHEILEEHAGCYEMVFVLSDDGYGVEVFIPKSERVDTRLLALCQRYAIPAQEPTEP